MPANSLTNTNKSKGAKPKRNRAKGASGATQNITHNANKSKELSIALLANVKVQQDIGAQQQTNQTQKMIDVDASITVELEKQLLQIEVEKLLSLCSGHNDIALAIVRVHSRKVNNSSSCLYLVDSRGKTAEVNSASLRINNKLVAEVTQNSQRDLELLTALQSTEVYLHYRQKLYTKLIEFYKKLLALPRTAYEDLRTAIAFWWQLNLLEKYIRATSRFRLITANATAIQNQSRSQQNSNYSNMVHEIGSNAALSQDGIVNSASLEDVPLSETSDRAQSIQSLHSAIDTPTPDTTPSYEELQQRLDEYNRHIEQMNEQKQQLLRMHKAAKDHLAALEQYQNQNSTKNLSFGGKEKEIGGGGSGSSSDNIQPPNYDSVDEVQSDMAILSQRVKNITRIVDNQKHLVSQLDGETAAEMRADQAMLEQKLKNLRKDGDDLRSMATELDTLNINAVLGGERRAEEDEGNLKTATTSTERKPTAERSRVVPIRMTANGTDTRKTIEQKESEIDAMKAQLRRLKEMMGTIESMESKTNSATLPSTSNNEREHAVDYDRDRTPTASSSSMRDDLRRLHGVQSDMRAQSERMAAEKERIMALQDDISRCSQQAAAAAQLGEEALKRNSITPTPQSYQRSNDTIDMDYEPQAARSHQQQPHPTIGANHRTADSFDNSSTAEDAPYGYEQTQAQESVPATTAAGGVLQHEIGTTTNLPAAAGSGNLIPPHSVQLPMTNISGGVTWTASPPQPWTFAQIPYPNAPTNFSFPPPAYTMTTFAPNTTPMGIPVLSGQPAAMPVGGSPTVFDQTMMLNCLSQQQMLSNTVFHINNMIWRQQREIENLYRLVQALNERIIRLGGEPLVQLGVPTEGLRSESVPPPPPINELSGPNRAQSEQPMWTQQLSAPPRTHGIGQFYHHDHQQRHMQQRHHELQQQNHFNATNCGVNQQVSGSFTESHQQFAKASGSTTYATLNNAGVNGASGSGMQPQLTSHGSNGPAPIFMHHHNNAIHQNNANLRRANVQCSGAASNEWSSTLNNQVEPGNRTNNYWDYFRSCSQQNLLSAASSKSNEGSQQQQPNFVCDSSRHHDVGEYNPGEETYVQQNMRHQVEIVQRQPIATSDMRRNNWQQQTRQQQQQPNPLPSWSVISNPLNESAEPPMQRERQVNNNNSASSRPNTDNVLRRATVASSVSSSSRPLHNDPQQLQVDIDNNFTAEMYGCNYDQPTTTHATNINHEHNINLGNSPRNRRDNKVKSKIQYRMSTSCCEISEDSDADREIDVRISNRQTYRSRHLRQLRELHQLESILQPDSRCTGTGFGCGGFTGMPMESNFSDHQHHFSNNGRRQTRSTNITRSVSERNLLMHNRADKAEVIKQHVSGTLRRQIDNRNTAFEDGDRPWINIESSTEEPMHETPLQTETNSSSGSKTEVSTETDTNVMIAGNVASINGVVGIQPNPTDTEAAADAIELQVNESKVNATAVEAAHKFVPTATTVRKVSDDNGDTTGAENCSKLKTGAAAIATNSIETKIISVNGAKETLTTPGTNENIDMQAKSDSAAAQTSESGVPTTISHTVETSSLQTAIASTISTSSATKIETKIFRQKIAYKAPVNEDPNDVLKIHDATTAHTSCMGGAYSIEAQQDLHLEEKCRELLKHIMNLLRLRLRTFEKFDEHTLKLVTRTTAEISYLLVGNRFPRSIPVIVIFSARQLLQNLVPYECNIPQQREQFFQWYENFLFNLLMSGSKDQERSTEHTGRLGKLIEAIEVNQHEKRQKDLLAQRLDITLQHDLASGYDERLATQALTDQSVGGDANNIVLPPPADFGDDDNDDVEYKKQKMPNKKKSGAGKKHKINGSKSHKKR